MTGLTTVASTSFPQSQHRCRYLGRYLRAGRHAEQDEAYKSCNSQQCSLLVETPLTVSPVSKRRRLSESTGTWQMTNDDSWTTEWYVKRRMELTNIKRALLVKQTFLLVYCADGIILCYLTSENMHSLQTTHENNNRNTYTLL